MKLSEIRPGDVLTAGAGHDCFLAHSEHVVAADENRDLYIQCRVHGRHYLEDEQSADKTRIVGFGRKGHADER